MLTTWVETISFVCGVRFPTPPIGGGKSKQQASYSRSFLGLPLSTIIVPYHHHHHHHPPSILLLNYSWVIMEAASGFHANTFLSIVLAHGFVCFSRLHFRSLWIAICVALQICHSFFFQLRISIRDRHIFDAE